MRAVLKSIQISMRSTIGLFFMLATTTAVGLAVDTDSGPLPPSITTAPLSIDQVVNNLIRKDAERAQALRHYESTRVYHLSYRGFLGDRDAEMTVDCTYDSPSTKSFKIISETGSKAMVEHAFRRLLDGEKEAAEPAENARTLLNHDNYDFALVGFESSDKGNQYVLAVRPKTISKYVYRGKVWVDATDFAVTRIDVEPALNPSFWTKQNRVRHEYMKVQNFWLPRRNESVSEIRFGGRATLTIEYSNYRDIDSRDSGKPKALSAGAAAR